MAETPAQEIQKIDQSMGEWREQILQKFEQTEKVMKELRKMVEDRGVQLAQAVSNLSRLAPATLNQGEPIRSIARTENVTMPFGRIGKVEFPRFNGDDFPNWLHHCERFFEFEGITDEFKLRLVILHLEGKALWWHRGFMRERTEEAGPLTWAEYLQAMKDEFDEQVNEEYVAAKVELSDTSKEEVPKLIQCSEQYQVPNVSYNGAKLVEGHTLSSTDGVCIDMPVMKWIKAIEAEPGNQLSDLLYAESPQGSAELSLHVSQTTSADLNNTFKEGSNNLKQLNDSCSREFSKARKKTVMPKEPRDRDGVEKLKDGLKRKNEMVFDPGGGIFHVSMLTNKGSIFELMASTRNTQLDENDLDKWMDHQFAQKLKKKHKEDISRNPRALRRFRTIYEREKSNLSSIPQFKTEMDYWYEEVKSYFTNVSPSIEEIYIDIFMKHMELADKCLRAAKRDKNNTHNVLILGDPTRILKLRQQNFKKICNEHLGSVFLSGKTFQQQLQGFLIGNEPCPSTISDEGAAYRATVRTANSGEGNVKGTTNPTQEEQVFLTYLDNRPSVLLQTCEGEKARVYDNNRLDMFEISSIPPNLRRVPQFMICFKVAANDIFTVLVEDKTIALKNKIAIISDMGGDSKQVVYTMSMALKLNWTCGSNKEYCRDTTNQDRFSTKAEGVALECAKRNGLNIVAICPDLIKLVRGMYIQLIQGGDDYVSYRLQNTVNVRDDAEAIIMAYEKSEASLGLKPPLRVPYSPQNPGIKGVDQQHAAWEEFIWEMKSNLRIACSSTGC